MHKRLRQKGWSEKELKRLQASKLEAAKLRKGLARLVHNYLFPFVVASAIIMNFVLAFVFLPLFMMLNSASLFLMIIIAGVFFGLMFENLLFHVEELSRPRQMVVLAVVPGVAAFGFIAFAQFANFIALYIGLLGVRHNPIIIGVVYAVSFFVPLALKRA